MDNIITWIILLGATLSSCISISPFVCKDSADCTDPEKPSIIKFLIHPHGPQYYSPPGPISLRCDVKGDLQYIFWGREGADGKYVMLNSTTFRKLRTSQWTATLENYLLRENFPYKYRCFATEKCCNEKGSNIKTVKMNPDAVFPDDVCIKDTVIILDHSGSISRKMLNNSLKPFVHRLVDDKRLNVSQNGSHVAVITFGNTADLQLPFARGYSPLLVKEAISKSRIEPGARTRTDLALKLANKLFTEKKLESKNQFHHNDVIVLLTDGDPTLPDRALAEAKKLQKKEVTIIGVIARSLQNSRYSRVVKEMYTPDELLYITLDDVVDTVDRVVDGICKERATVSSKPNNVTVFQSGNTINVSWIPPKYVHYNIIYYAISWGKYKEKTAIVNERNVTSTYVVIEVSSPGYYSIYISAVDNHVRKGEAVNKLVEVPDLFDATSSIVISTPTISILKTTIIPISTQISKSNTVAVACGVTGSVLFLVLIMVGYFIRKKIRKKQHDRSLKEFQSWQERHHDSGNIPKSATQELVPLNKKTDSVPECLSYVTLLEDWGISSKNLKLLDKKLGGGQFGIVKQGLLDTGNGETEVVAVKMLKESANETALSDLLSELNILKEVNKHSHPNVIRFIGGCSLEGKLLLVTEFCAGGSLRKFLIKSRVKYDVDSTKENLTSTLSYRQLLKISVEVASGMVHLSAQKFVHRDLAARNILIGEDNIAKVSDFGLARDIGGAEEYIRSNQNLLPVKWMALESLLHGRFTTASDVWSFGVLLHEITTLGEEPYKNISPYNIINHVGSGCRMPKPIHCSSELYEIMTNCWKVRPKDRPTFSEILETLYDMQVDNERSYINVLQVQDEELPITIEPNHVSTKDDQTAA